MSTASSQLESTIKIVTPENIAFDYRVAGPFRRLPAFLIDLALRIAVAVGLYFVCGLLSIGIGAASFGFWLVSLFVMGWFYGGLFETFMNGQTPGKRLVGIRVLSVNGQPINGLQAVMRNVLRDVDVAPVITAAVVGLPPIPLVPTCLVGLLTMAMTRRFQRLGDLVCRTMVVIEQRPWLAGVARIEDPRAFQLASYLPADLQVVRSMAQTLAFYAERRQYFTVPRRREIARHLAEPLLVRFGLPGDTSYDLLLCAMYYRLFIADRQEDELHAARAEAALGQTGAPEIMFLDEPPGPAPADGVRV